MSKPIIAGEVLIYAPEQEPLCITETSEAEYLPTNRVWTRRLGISALILSTYGSFVAADNAIYYYDTAKIHADDGSMIEDLDGCDTFPVIRVDETTNTTLAPANVTPEQIEATLEVESEFSNTKSAVKNFSPKGFSLKKFLSDWLNVHRHEQFSFESKITGLDIHIFSDSAEYPFKNNPTDMAQSIDELLHSSLNPDVDYDHITVDAYASCLYERFIDSDGARELEDKRLNLFIPSTPGKCFSNNLVQDFPEGAKSKDFCDSIGATYAGVRIALRPFYEYNRDWMVVMSHKKQPEDYEPRLSKLLIHEGTHLFMQYGGLPIQHTPNERLADYQEMQTINSLYADGLPLSVSYP